jgi:cell division protein FtsQ
LCVGVAIGVLGIALQRYGTGSWRFRLDSSDNIAISGTNNVSRAQVRNVMASDIDRNVFFVPLEERKKQLEQIPWVQSASVMRLLPNRLKIDITERTPVAFVEIGSHIALIDANGVIMELPPGQTTKYSFPVVVGISDGDPLSTRAARMKIYSQFVNELDSSGGHYSADISDVDLTDPYDIKATVTDPHGAVLVHLGPANFLGHFKVYVAHVQEWRTQFKKLESVDLRYDHQVIVNPDSPGVEVPQTAANTPASAVTATPQQPAQQKKTAPSKTKKHT